MFRPVAAVFAVLSSGFLSACQPTATPAAEAEAVTAPVVEKEPEIAAPALGAEVVLTMTCSALATSEGFTREVTLTGGDAVYTWTRGTKDEVRYENWEMKLDGGNAFTVTGEYIEGAPGLKPISFTGTVVGAVVTGEGKRGPRNCTIKS